ncbi:MAG: hypothetical protein GY730_00340 [bacterium]|nr:hypothetical protein [bacterium]
MNDNEKLLKIKEINEDIELGKNLTNIDTDFLFSCLPDTSVNIVANAALALTILEKPILLKITEFFNTLPAQSQKILIPLLASTDHYEMYKFLLIKLKESEYDELCNFIILCLSKSHYFFFPLILSQLKDADKIYKIKLKQLLLTLGFVKIAPYIGMFPEIPFESFFRETFGDERINTLKD